MTRPRALPEAAEAQLFNHEEHEAHEEDVNRSVLSPADSD
jgi:hypothetical protein